MKYKPGDIIEKQDGNIAKVIDISFLGNDISGRLYYHVGCQGEYWYLEDSEIKGLAARPAKNRDKVSRFELMDLDEV